MRFSLDGVAYTVDLSRAQAHSLRAVLAPFIAAARPTSADPSWAPARLRAHARRNGR